MMCYDVRIMTSVRQTITTLFDSEFMLYQEKYIAFRLVYSVLS